MSGLVILIKNSVYWGVKESNCNEKKCNFLEVI